MTSLRKGTETELLIGSRNLRHLEPHGSTRPLFRFVADSWQQGMSKLPLSSQVGPQFWRTVASEHIAIAQNSTWLHVVRSARSDAPLLSGIVLDCFGLQYVG